MGDAVDLPRDINTKLSRYFGGKAPRTVELDYRIKPSALTSLNKEVKIITLSIELRRITNKYFCFLTSIKQAAKGTSTTVERIKGK